MHEETKPVAYKLAFDIEKEIFERVLAKFDDSDDEGLTTTLINVFQFLGVRLSTVYGDNQVVEMVIDALDAVTKETLEANKNLN